MCNVKKMITIMLLFILMVLVLPYRVSKAANEVTVSNTVKEPTSSNTNTEKNEKPVKVILNKDYLELKIKNSEKLTVISPSLSESDSVQWKSDNDSIATVSSDGIVTAIRHGSTKITATVGEESACCKVYVYEEPVPNVSGTVEKAPEKAPTIEPSKPSLGKTFYILILNLDNIDTLRKYINSYTSEKLKWSSSNENVVTVDQNGKVRAVGPGSAEITAEVEDIEDKYEDSRIAIFKTTVPDIKIAGVNLKSNKTKIKVNKKANLSYNLIPNKVTESVDKVVYKSSDETIAVVDNDGVVTGLKPGKVRISVLVNERISDEIEIKVVKNKNKGNESNANENNGSVDNASGDTGNENTGSGNTGNENTGNGNTENESTGSGNTGNENTGSGNSGNENTGNGSNANGDNENGNTTTGNNENDKDYNENNESYSLLPKTGDIPIILFVVLLFVSLTGIIC